jgi:hypothetical protein
MLLKVFKILICFAFVLNAGSLFAQSNDNPKSMSLGRTSVANSFNIDALNNNPANLVYNGTFDNSNYYISVFSSAGYMMNSEFLTLDFYNKYFTGKNGEARLLGDAEKKDILKQSSNTASNFGVNMKFFGMVIKDKDIGAFGFSVEDRIMGKNYLPADAMDVALFGNAKNRLYDFSDFDIDMSWIRQLNFSYAREFNDLFSGIDGFSAGISIKPELGYYNFNMHNNDLTLHTDDSNKISAVGSMIMRSSRIGKEKGSIVFPEFTEIAGFGMAFDIGFHFKLDKKWDVGLSVTDIGWLNWYKNPKEYLYEGGFVITDLGNGEQYDQLLDLIEGTSQTIPNYIESMPATLHLGVNYKIFDPIFSKNSIERANLSFEYAQGLSNTSGTSMKPLFFLGGEYILSQYFIPRIGFVLGDSENLAVGLGAGFIISNLIIDVGTHNIISVFDLNKSTKNSFGISMKLKFD